MIEQTPAAKLLDYLLVTLDAAPIMPNSTTADVVDLISGAPPEGKKVLLAAIGKAMIRSEVERQAKKAKSVEKLKA